MVGGRVRAKHLRDETDEESETDVPLEVYALNVFCFSFLFCEQIFKVIFCALQAPNSEKSTPRTDLLKIFLENALAAQNRILRHKK